MFVPCAFEYPGTLCSAWRPWLNAYANSFDSIPRRIRRRNRIMITCMSCYFPNSVIRDHLAVRQSPSSLYTLGSTCTTAPFERGGGGQCWRGREGNPPLEKSPILSKPPNMWFKWMHKTEIHHVLACPKISVQNWPHPHMFTVLGKE